MNKIKKHLISITSIVFPSIFILCNCNSNNKEVEVGFECVDNNINNYTTNSVFDNDNGIEVYAKFLSGKKTKLNKSEYSYTTSSNSTEIDTSHPFQYSGTYTCTIKYKNYENQSYSFNVTKEEKIVTSIAIEHGANKTSFETGEKYTSEGITLKVFYKNFPSEIITSNYTSNYDLYEFKNSDIGVKNVTITYKNQTTNYQINIFKPIKTITSIDQYTPANKLTYDIGETFSYEGLSLKITYSDTSSEIIASNFTTNFDNHEFTENDVGNKQVLVNYKNYLITYNIVINKTIIEATDISISPSYYECLTNSSKQLQINYVPYNANTGKELSWESSNENIATVDSNGLVQIKETAQLGDTFTIKATLTAKSKTSTCNFKVVNYKTNSNTIMIYMSGNDLESKNGLATDDIKEMLAATGQNEYVNIIIQTGGCNSWKNYDIANDKIGRYHIQNRKLVLDKQLPQANMGDSSTLEDFISWGLSNYPADKTSLILWNHGRAMQGICFDQNYNEDSLTVAEVKKAITNAFNKCQHNKKFEFIGYDACIMQVQDIASINSEFANYMICSQENEEAGGWHYTTWLNNLFTYPEMNGLDLVKTISNAYLTHCNEDYYTISILDLSKIDNYIIAFEELAKNISIIIENSPSTNWTKLCEIMNASLKFGYSSKYSYHYPYDVFDVDSFLNNLILNETFSTLDISKVKEAMKDLISINKYGPYYQGRKPCGLSMFAPISGYTSINQYTTEDTKLLNWRDICIKYGNWKTTANQ